MRFITYILKLIFIIIIESHIIIKSHNFLNNTVCLLKFHCSTLASMGAYVLFHNTGTCPSQIHEMWQGQSP